VDPAKNSSNIYFTDGYKVDDAPASL
jgi:hypothetical protein